MTRTTRETRRPGCATLVRLALVIAGLASRGPAAQPPIADSPSTPTLRHLAEAREVRIGAMILDDDWRTPAQQALVSREFNAATIGTFWTRTHPERNRWDWRLTDEAIEFAQQHDMAVHLHPVLYPADDKNPAWVTQSPQSEAHGILSAHVREALGRYRGRCAVWDVVNEAVAPNGRGLRDCWWRRALGPDYVTEVFRLCREADPDAVFLYNDYGCEQTDALQTRRWQVALQIVRRLQAEGLVDGMGWQLHTTPEQALAPSFALEARMREIASLGLANYVTELDVAIPDGSPESLQRQAEAYRRIAEIWLRQRGEGWLQTWGVSDRHSWLDRPGAGGKRRPLLFDESWRPKPAYEALCEALAAPQPELRSPAK